MLASRPDAYDLPCRPRAPDGLVRHVQLVGEAPTS